MKRLLFCISMFTVLFSISSCEENQMDDYDNTPAIYFTRNDGQSDSINYSFFVMKSTIKRDTVHVRVYSMGKRTNYDRPIEIVQTNKDKPNAAKPGVHYVAFDDMEVKNSFCIAAEKVYVDLPIIVLRDPSLSSQEKRLELSVKENKYFNIGISEWSKFVVTISDLTAKPKLWDSFWIYFFGKSWGVVKMRFIVESTGYSEWESRPLDYSYLTWLSATARQALLDYNSAHPGDPLKETNGDIISLDK